MRRSPGMTVEEYQAHVEVTMEFFEESREEAEKRIARMMGWYPPGFSPPRREDCASYQGAVAAGIVQPERAEKAA